MYQIHGIGCGHFTAEDLDQAQQIAIGYEFFGNAPYIVSADGAIVSNGSQAQRVIDHTRKMRWLRERIAKLEWWISVYRARGAQNFVADLALLEKHLAEISTLQ